MSSSIQPLPAVWKGTKYRSRLEARWAIYFDRLHEPFQYEPEGYDLGHGVGSYLPDFWLPECGVFVEIKPERPTDEEASKADALAKRTGRACLVMSGPPTNHHGEFFGQDATDSTGGESASGYDFRAMAIRCGDNAARMFFVTTNDWRDRQFMDYEYRPLDRVVNQMMLGTIDGRLSIEDAIAKSAATSWCFWNLPT